MNAGSFVIGIAGDGKMGTNIFNYLFDFPFPLIWKCHPSSDTDRLRRNVEKKLRRAGESGILDEKVLAIRHASTLVTSRDEDLAGCSLLIESISEDRELKLNFFRTADRIIAQECIFTSNSSSILPSELCPSTGRLENFAGLHFFYPVALKNIVELTLPKGTSAGTRRTLRDFLGVIRRNFLLLTESNSFILNRIFLDFQNEAFRLVQDSNITFRRMDRIVTENFFQAGVFCFFDSVGLDTMLASVKNYTRDYPHKDYYAGLIRDLEQRVQRGDLGQKSGRGYYDYPGSGEPPVPESDPGMTGEIVTHLRHTLISAIKRFGARSGIPLDELKDSLNEYFGVEWNLFP